MSGRQRVRCDRCRRAERVNRADRDGWNVVMRAGRPVGNLCPQCQTPEENAEAEINLATLDYLGQGIDGRYRARPKAGEAS